MPDNEMYFHRADTLRYARKGKAHAKMFKRPHQMSYGGSVYWKHHMTVALFFWCNAKKPKNP